MKAGNRSVTCPNCYENRGKIIGTEKMRTEAYRSLSEKVIMYTGGKEKGIIFRHTTVTKQTFAQLRDSLLGQGKILEEDFRKKMYVISIMAGAADMNEAVVAVRLSGDSLDFAGYAREGLIKQHTAEKAIEKICSVIHAGVCSPDISGGRATGPGSEQ